LGYLDGEGLGEGIWQLFEYYFRGISGSNKKSYRRAYMGIEYQLE